MELEIKDLHRFTTFVVSIKLAFHQYLLNTSEPVLFHTGNAAQAAALLPQLKEALDGKALKYIFVSHFEADECGGVSTILDAYPAAHVVCSEVTARQLDGFGLVKECVTRKPGEKLTTDDYELEFIGYPSEMHLWEGLLAIENRRKVFFSSDLMMRFGQVTTSMVPSAWQTEITGIRPEQIPDTERRMRLQSVLTKLKPQFVAPGHGPILDLRK